jgi:hypothetical protein
MNINNTSVPEQFGLRKGISTENTTFQLADKVLTAINKRNARIFCDLAKAF